MIKAEETKELQDWNKLVEDNWDYWQYYKDMINFSLQKSANSPITRHLYPFFYQERILKRKFTENMQMIGDITKEEAHQFNTQNKSIFFYQLYRFYRVPEGGRMKIFDLSVYVTSLIIFREAYKSRTPRFFWLFAPVSFIIGATACLQRFLILQLSQLVDMTQWVIEKRKAEVWTAQKLIDVPAMLPFPALRYTVLGTVLQEKMNNIPCE